MATDSKDKKRKASAVEPPAKKPKKTKTSEGSANKPVKKSSPAAAPNATTDNSVASKFTARKRAADFLSDDEDEKPPSKAVSQTDRLSNKKSKKSEGLPSVGNASNDTPDQDTTILKKKSSSAVQQNGVKKDKKEKAKTVNVGSDASKRKTTTAVDTAKGTKKDKKQKPIESAVEEAELSEEDVDEDNDQAATLLAGFDDDEPDTAEDKGLDADTPMPGLNKKAKKKLSQLDKTSAADGPGTIYIGRVPHGFYEHQMRAYFSQFGDITNLRLSRNRKSGASKHFAFLEFASSEVAKIAAASMDNYLLFGHILKCKFVPQENVHPDTWKGSNRRYKATPWNRLERQKMEKPKTKEQWETKNVREQKKREAKLEKMKDLGYEFKAPKLKSIAEIGTGGDSTAEEQLAIELTEAANPVKPAKKTGKKQKAKK